jgi:hypothetical protein
MNVHLNINLKYFWNCVYLLSTLASWNSLRREHLSVVTAFNFVSVYWLNLARYTINTFAELDDHLLFTCINADQFCLGQAIRVMEIGRHLQQNAGMRFSGQYTCWADFKRFWRWHVGLKITAFLFLFLRNPIEYVSPPPSPEDFNGLDSERNITRCTKSKPALILTPAGFYIAHCVGLLLGSSLLKIPRWNSLPDFRIVKRTRPRNCVS